jgi:hypothetical protein
MFMDNETAIRDYCDRHGLNFEKAKNSPKCFNKTEIFLQYVDEELGRQEIMGLIPPTPAPVTLMIRKTDRGLMFEQTEHTAEHLAM